MPSSTPNPSPSTTPFGKRIHSIVTWLMGLGLLAYVVVVAGLYFFQESLLFKPVVIPANQPLAALKTQADANGGGVREFTVPVSGATLSGLHLTLPNPKGVVFFLHGNRGNLDEWFVNTALYRQNNMDLVMIDYRGFGKSTGQIASEAQLRSDVRAAYDFIAPQYVGKKLVIYGRSLGTGLAAGLAADLYKAHTIVDMTVLVSPYSSLRALTGEIYPLVPQAALRYPLRTDELLPLVKSPLLLIHGDQDALIPPSHSKTLKSLVPQARLLLVKGAGHGDIHKFDAYLQDFGGVLAGL